MSVIYRNDGTIEAILGRFGRVKPGKTVIVSEFVDLGDDTPFTLVSADAPWDVLHEGALPVDIASGLSGYEQIEVINMSGASASMIANGDTARPRLIPDANNRFLSFPKRLESLSVTGSGTDYVYVYGDRREGA